MLLYMNTNIHSRLYFSQFFLEWEIFRTQVVEKIKTHILCPIKVFENCRLWYSLESIVEPEGPKTTIWCTHIACWYLSLQNIHSEHCFSTVNMGAWQRLNITLYVHYLSGFMYCHLSLGTAVVFKKYCHISGLHVVSPQCYDLTGYSNFEDFRCQVSAIPSA
jgi:hypothetical protein